MLKPPNLVSIFDDYPRIRMAKEYMNAINSSGPLFGRSSATQWIGLARLGSPLGASAGRRQARLWKSQTMVEVRLESIVYRPPHQAWDGAADPGAGAGGVYGTGIPGTAGLRRAGGGASGASDLSVDGGGSRSGDGLEVLCDGDAVVQCGGHAGALRASAGAGVAPFEPVALGAGVSDHRLQHGGQFCHQHGLAGLCG